MKPLPIKPIRNVALGALSFMEASALEHDSEKLNLGEHHAHTKIRLVVRPAPPSGLESALAPVDQHQRQQRGAEDDLPSECRDVQRGENALEHHQEDCSGHGAGI